MTDMPLRKHTCWYWSIRLVLAWAWVQASSGLVGAQTGPAEGKEGLVELGKDDPRLKGHYAPKGFKVQIIAAEPTIVDPTGMAFDDQGTLYVAEWKHADHMFDTYETLKLPEGGTTRVMRRRKATTDVVKRLRDTNGDGVYDSSEVVVDGAEMPSSIFPWKNSLYLTCVGRLERWSDEDGDGKFELKTIIADGFCGFYHHWLSGMTLGADGWFYLTAGDNDNHVIGSDGSRVEVSRCGAIFRGRVDGSDMHLFAMGFRNPYRDVVFNSSFNAFHVDNDNEDGSKFQGVRLINAVEDGDYGWRLLPGAPCCQPDFDRGAVDGELPGKLPIITKTGRGAPAGLLVYNGTAFPKKYRDLCIYPDVFRKLVRGYRVEPKGGSYRLAETLTLLTSDDDLFRPCQTVVGADGAIYVLDWRSNSGGAGRLWGDGKYGRLYKLTWEGDGETPALPVKPNNWTRVLKGSDADVMASIRGLDYGEARRAIREYVSRGPLPRRPMPANVLPGEEAPRAMPENVSQGGDSERASALLSLMRDRSTQPHARMMGLQGARQLWSDLVEREMVDALDDPLPEIRRLAAQALSWEPKERRPSLVPALVAHLNEPEGRALRDIALALGRHGWAVPGDAAPPLWAWLAAHSNADVAVRDAFIRALERLGDPGVEEVAHVIRSSKPSSEREQAVAVFTAFRTVAAAKKLPGLATIANLSGPERLSLVRMFKDVPLNIPLSTQSLEEWISAHPETDSATKVATMDVCRLAGNPASALVLKLLDDADESVRLAALQLAGQSLQQVAVQKLLARIAEPDRSLAERIAVTRALRDAGPGAFDAIASAYRTFGADVSFAPVALRALADSDRSRAEPIAREALESKLPELKREALQVLGETPQSALMLGKAFLDGKLGRAELPVVLAAVRRYNSPDHQKILAEIDQAAAKGIASLSIDEIKSRVAHGADAWRGLKVYLRDSGSRCFTCHKIENFGGNVGPALTGVSQALSIDKLIESMLQPSKEIKEGYEAYKVALKDGRVLSGIKVSQDANTLVLRDSNAQETRIAAAEIEEQAKDPVSLMPVGLLNDLSPDEFADLIAFMLSKPAQETLRNTQRIDHMLAMGPLPEGKEGDVIGGGDSAAAKADSGAGGVGRGASWVPLDTNSGGTFNLRGQFGANRGTALLAASIRSDAPQDVSLRFGIPGRVRVYLNGSKVGESALIRSMGLDGVLTRLPLHGGWNSLVVAVDGSALGGGATGTLSIGSAQPVEVKPARPADAKSAQSP